ncbi:MAG: SCO family protein, partial [Myxococcales bacterium]|nr:SCO family protein [Myxococcales bacterium]
MLASLRVSLLAMVAVMATVVPARAQLNQPAPQTEGVGIEEHLDAPLPRDATFRDHTGQVVRLADFFDGKRPVVVNFAYHSCPVLCNMVLNSTIDSLAKQQWQVGREFDVISISIDPKDTPASAAKKRDQAIQKYGRGDGKGWHFLVGTKEEVARVADAAGFQFKYDKATAQYAHAAVMMLASPEGRMARYLYGVQFNHNDVKIGLLDASEGKAISSVEHLILYCYRFDPKANSYVVVATRVMQIGGALTAIALFAFLFVMWRRELRRR